MPVVSLVRIIFSTWGKKLAVERTAAAPPTQSTRLSVIINARNRESAGFYVARRPPLRLRYSDFVGEPASPADQDLFGGGEYRNIGAICGDGSRRNALIAQKNEGGEGPRHFTLDM